MLNSPAVAAAILDLAEFLNKKAPGGGQGSGGRCGAVDGSKCPSFEDDNAFFQGSEPRQGFLCRACRRSKWLPKSSAAWCRVRQCWVRFDEPVRYCREFRAALTHGEDSGMVEAPKYIVKVSDTFSTLPRGGRTFVRKSFAIKRPAGGVSAGGDFVHIGGNASSVFREGTAAFDRGRGKQVLPPLCV